MTPVVLETRLDGPAMRATATAAALAATWAETVGDEPVVVVEVVEDMSAVRRRQPTLLCSRGAGELAELLGSEGFVAAARGRTCWVIVEADGERPWQLRVAAVAELCEGLAAGMVAWMEPVHWRAAIDSPDVETALAVVQCADRQRRDLLTLLARELVERRIALRVIGEGPGPLSARRALAGVSPGARVLDRFGRVLRTLARPDGQSLVLSIGLCAVLLMVALALVALGGAVTGKAKMQRAADLAALAAVESMHGDLPRFLAPATLPDGSPNPARLDRSRYFARSRNAALEIAVANEVPEDSVMVMFPDAGGDPPLRARVRIAGNLDSGSREGADHPVTVAAEAVASPVAGFNASPAVATGGGYSGPLAYRLGVPMRPDVADAFDRLAAAASRGGHRLTIASGFRSDAEQARLFAARPDPRWVAPPGRSLHRCGTELDLGPPSAYGWLANNAGSFGFLKRYSWEPWHFGFTAGAAPCSGVAEAGGSAEPDGAGEDPSPAAAPAAVPDFVPVTLRPVIVRTAARHGLPAALLAAQLKAESDFRPDVVSSAGAMGIAQFMPGTAAAWGLSDPFDPVESIRAQGRFMAHLVEQFGSTSLALAAYNAGPGRVAVCNCIPPFPETQAYVARIVALMSASGTGGGEGGMTIRLVE